MIPTRVWYGYSTDIYTGHDLKEGQFTSRTYMHTNHITISRVLH